MLHNPAVVGMGLHFDFCHRPTANSIAGNTKTIKPTKPCEVLWSQCRLLVYPDNDTPTTHLPRQSLTRLLSRLAKKPKVRPGFRPRLPHNLQKCLVCWPSPLPVVLLWNSCVRSGRSHFSQYAYDVQLGMHIYKPQMTEAGHYKFEPGL